ncbi:uncharacterized protein LOC131234821 [Magnolia sinica]|uniref:uncharacterized protein LOC131234821 n=1 Tax=Magnolia sinica TaxID=86752 RepID=UPI00265962EA|nr:uncharacterized protein LOC131234821 [Magnolia sinica]
MVRSCVIAALLFALALVRVQFSTCDVVKGSVSCLDCTRQYDLSGIKLAVKCNQDQRLAFAITEDNGFFQAQLPLASSSHSSQSPKCLAMILGGPQQLCSSKKALTSKIIRAHDSNSYTTSSPLTFSTTCPLKDPKAKKTIQGAKKGGPKPTFESKTIDLPLPPEWGMAPSSYYVPFFPIIGIP